MVCSGRGFRALGWVVGFVGVGVLVMLGTAACAVAGGSGGGLILGRVAPVGGVRPWTAFEAPGIFENQGTRALERVWLRYTVTQGLGYGDVPSNCVRWDIGSYDEMPARSQMICEFDQAVEPGVAYGPGKLNIEALDRALYDVLDVAVGDYDFGPEEGASRPVRGTAPAVKLVERPGTVLTGNSSVSHGYVETRVRVNTVNTADFQVWGAGLVGRVGDTVDLEVRFINVGPAWVLVNPGPAVPTRVLVRIPPGTTAVKAPKCKKPAAGTYDCFVAQGWVERGEVNTYSFRLRIDKAVAQARGTVSLNAGSRPYDVNKANDRAGIVLDVEGGGSTGGSGSSGGTGSPLFLAGAAAVGVAAGAGAVLLVRRGRARAK